MRRSTERILTTHTGSLPRPRDLAQTLHAIDQGEAEGTPAFRDRVRGAVHEVVLKQVETGIDIVNDGEQGKGGYHTYIRHRLTGFEGESVVKFTYEWSDFPLAAGRHVARAATARPACTGPIEWKDRTALEAEIADLRAAGADARPTEVFATAASPGVIAHFLGNRYYPTREAYLARLADVMKEEYDALHRAGFVLQVDCPDLAMSRHTAFADLSTAEWLKVIAMNAEALDHALRDIPPDQVRMHLCWGNYLGPHHRDVPLRDVIDLVLRMRPQGLSFEAANPRHAHEWKVFEEVTVPDGKVLIPGMLDVRTNTIEHPELIAQRIVRYAELVGRENVIAGSDCGFATVAWSTPMVEPEVAWAKLRSLAEGAAIATRRLWA